MTGRTVELQYSMADLVFTSPQHGQCLNGLNPQKNRSQQCHVTCMSTRIVSTCPPNVQLVLSTVHPGREHLGQVLLFFFVQNQLMMLVLFSITSA
jgi:hypothetical protein